jgi:hypothetical protein
MTNGAPVFRGASVCGGLDGDNRAELHFPEEIAAPRMATDISCARPAGGICCASVPNEIDACSAPCIYFRAAIRRCAAPLNSSRKTPANAADSTRFAQSGWFSASNEDDRRMMSTSGIDGRYRSNALPAATERVAAGSSPSTGNIRMSNSNQNNERREGQSQQNERREGQSQQNERREGQSQQNERNNNNERR